MEKEIVIGQTINEANEIIFNEFLNTFKEYISFVSGIQTALLNEKFTTDEECVSQKMEVWLESKGIGKDAWSFQ